MPKEPIPTASIAYIFMLDPLDADMNADLSAWQAIACDAGIEAFLAVPAGLTPPAMAALADRFPQARIIAYRHSPYEAVNTAAREARGRHACLLRPGISLHENAMAAMCRLLDESPDSHAGMAWLADGNRQKNADNAFVPVGATQHTHADALFSRHEPSMLIWKNLPAEPLVFDESMVFLADEDLTIRLARAGRLLAFTGTVGVHHAGQKHADVQYRQLCYEEELRTKETHIRHFLSDAVPQTSHLHARLLLHTKTIMLYYKQLGAGSTGIDAREFDRQGFFHALLLAKTGHVDDAMNSLRTHLKTMGESRNAAHLYRILLTPFLGAPVCIPPKRQAAPLVSIPMALYNHGHYLETALQSVFAQTMPDWEIVIINDGSTDNSLRTAKALLEKYGDSRLRIVSKQNEGLPKTRTRGMQETSAPYVCQLDPDDLIAPDYLEKALDILESEPDVGWVTPPTLVFGGSNHIAWDWEYDLVQSALRCPSPALALFRRSMWEGLGGYRDAIPCREDWEFWIRAGEEGWVSRTMPDIKFIYRHAFKRWGTTNKNNISSKKFIVEHHPWWFKQMNEREMYTCFLQIDVGAFPHDMLNEDTVERYRAVQGDRAAVQNLTHELKRRHAHGMPRKA